MIPEANPNLIFSVSREHSRIFMRCALVGARSRFADVSMANRIFTCGARLRPGALPSLTRLPASDFADRSVPVRDVFGKRGASLMEQLRELKSPFSALAVISDFLSREWSDRNCISMLPSGWCNRVAHMAAQSGVPVRTLHSQLMQHVGLSPKRLLRIKRLHRALVSSQNRSLSWAEIASDSGFADQPHMVREFHDLLGESPTLWSQRSHLPICSRQ